MITPRKALFWFLSCIILLFLIYSSYIYQKNTSNFSEPQIPNLTESEQFLGEDNTLSSENGDIQVDFLDYSDTILSYQSQMSKENEKINLEQGNFLVDISEINSQYEFSGTGFHIQNTGPTTFYVDNSNPKKTYIFSLTSWLKIDILASETGEKVNEIFLYPNEFVAFSPTTNKIIKGSDLLRVSQVLSLGYIGESVLSNGNLNENWSKKVLFGEEEKKKKLEQMVSYLVKEETEDKKMIENFINDKKVSISWEAFIEQYFQMFLNPEKKKVYFKNIILRETAQILQKNNISKTAGAYLKENLEQLKNTDKSSYEDMKNIVIFYLNKAEKWETSSEKKMILSHILYDIQGKESSFERTDLLDLYEAFKVYHFENGKNLYGNLKDFTEKHLQQNLSSTEKWYFIFFLNTSILSGFEKMNAGENLNFDDLLAIINNYTTTSIEFYTANNETDTTKQQKIRETGIKTYNTIFTKLKQRIRENYFKEELTDKGLLIKKEGIETESEKISELKSSITKLYFFYKKYKTLLSDTSINRLTINQIESSKKTLDSYFEALMDYSKYELNHNNVYENFRADASLSTEKKLQVADAQKYLKTFHYINLENTQISTKNSDYCYNPVAENAEGTDTFCFEIKNLEVNGGVQLDFFLFPSLGNTIDHIYKNGTEYNGSYGLDELQASYESNLITANKEEDTEKYKFENFFLYTFNPVNTNAQIREIYSSDEYTINQEENEIISAIKSGSLLWDKGTFAVVQEYLSVKYNDIIIKELDNTLKIQVKNAALNYEIWDKSYSGVLNSEYVFVKGKISSFKNPEITLTNNTSIRGIPIKINGIFPLDTFDTALEKMLSGTENMSKVIDAIEKTTSETHIEVKYNPNDNKIYISTEQVSVTLKGNFLQKISINWKNLLTKVDKIDNLSKYFTTNE